jgi:hypothetical protein
MVVIPSVIEILSQRSIFGISVFSICTWLISICIPALVEQIPSKGFEGCLKLRQVAFESGSKTLTFGWSAFSQAGLESISIFTSVIEIGQTCFSGSKLSDVSFEPNRKLSRMQESAFSGAPLRSICSPQSLTAVPSHCFQFCRSLSVVTFASPSTIRLIHADEFSSCSTLESICIPNSVETISGRAFETCSRFSTVAFELPSQLRSIGLFAFANCISLNSISIPASVDTISTRCFKKCTGAVHLTAIWHSNRCSFPVCSGSLRDQAPSPLAG